MGIRITLFRKLLRRPNLESRHGGIQSSRPIHAGLLHLRQFDGVAEWYSWKVVEDLSRAASGDERETGEVVMLS